MVKSRWEVFCGACSLSPLGDVRGCWEEELRGFVECLDDLEASATIVMLQNGWQMDFITCWLQGIDDGLCEEPRPCPGSSRSMVTH